SAPSAAFSPDATPKTVRRMPTSPVENGSAAGDCEEPPPALAELASAGTPASPGALAGLPLFRRHALPSRPLCLLVAPQDVPHVLPIRRHVENEGITLKADFSPAGNPVLVEQRLQLL